MPSFDIVSKIDMNELKNAVSNSMKEISQRYDFKGSISNIDLENDFLIVHTEDDLKAKQVNDILISNLVKRKIDPKLIGKKIGRNEPCYCGSNKKFKHCCGAI